MLKNFISSFGVAAVIASSVVYASPTRVTPAVLGAKTQEISFAQAITESQNATSSTAESIVVHATPSPSPVVKKIVASSPSATPKPSTAPITAVAVQLPAHELDALFQKYGAEYGVSWEKLKAIAKCESGFNAGVVSKNGLYGGLFQYLASTWSGTRKQMGLDPDPNLRFNAEEAIRTTAYKISVGGTGPWPHCGRK